MKTILLFFITAISAWDPTLGSIEGYYNLTEIYAMFDSLPKTYPDYKTHIIGKSYENRDIKALQINAGQGPAVLIIGCHHARELISVTQVLSLLYYITEGISDEITYLRNNREIWFIPVLNVDGYEYISGNYEKTKKILDIRKNRREFGDCPEHDYGVDLNRNYGYSFGIDDKGSSPNHCDEDHRGESAFSEPETKAIRELLATNNFVFAVSYHSYGNLYVHPWCYKNSFNPQDLRPEDMSLYNDLKRILPNDFQFGNPYELLKYAVNGCFIDYAYSLGIFGVAAEIANQFHPPKNDIAYALQGHLDPFLYLLKRAGPLMGLQLQNLTTHGSVIEFYLEIVNEGLQGSGNQTLVFELSHDYSVHHFFPYNVYTHEKQGKQTYITIPNIPKRSKQALMFKINVEEGTEEILYAMFFKPFSPINSGLSDSLKHKIEVGHSTALLWIVIFIIVLVAISVVVIFRVTRKRIKPIKFVEFGRYNTGNAQNA